MPRDIDAERKLAGNLSEYLQETGQALRTYRWVWDEFVTPEARKWVWRGVLALSLASVAVMFEPLGLKWAVDALTRRDGAGLVWSLVAYLSFLLVAHAFYVWYQRSREWAIGLIQCYLDVRTSELFFEKSMRQHLSDSDELSAANVEKGRNRAFLIIDNVMFRLSTNLMEVVLAFVFLFLNFPLLGSVLLPLLILHVVSSLLLNRQVVVRCTAIDAEHRRIIRYLVERWNSIERVLSNGKGEEEVRHLSSEFRTWIDRDRGFWLWFINMVGWRGLVNILALAATISYAAWRIWSGDWTIGTLVPLIIWLKHVVDKIWQVGDLELQLNWNLPSVMSLRQALTAPPDVTDAEDAVELPDEPVDVELRGVTHGYVDGTNGSRRVMDVLRDVGLSIGPGEKVALLGDSGAGKTTIMRLVMRYMDPGEGTVFVGGHDLRQVKLNSWRRLIGYIPQQAQVLDGTIRYNLLYGLPEAERSKVSDEELWRVMRLLKIDFGERLSDGLETVVGRHGIKLSGGQAQRLMIGAAVLKRPRFMVIDEATSSLDSTTELAVQRGLAELLGPDVSALIVTHRLSTVRKLCDRFVVLRPIEEVGEGESQVETVAGSFEELYATSATFRRLADDQGLGLGAA
ncbi:MAG: ABC transporter ATP-binding protein [bacterium]